MRCMRVSFVIYSILFSAFAYGVEGNNVLTKYQLVGVISDGKVGEKDSGIVVVKDVESQRSVMLRVGQGLPYMNQWKIEAISRTGVVLTDGGSKVNLSYYSHLAPDMPYKSVNEPTVRFISEDQEEEEWPAEGLAEQGIEADRFREAIDRYLEDFDDDSLAEPVDLDSVSDTGLNRQIRSFDRLSEYKKSVDDESESEDETSFVAEAGYDSDANGDQPYEPTVTEDDPDASEPQSAQGSPGFFYP